MAGVLAIKPCLWDKLAMQAQFRKNDSPVKMKFTRLGEYVDSKMAPVLPVKKKKKPLDVKVKQLPC